MKGNYFSPKGSYFFAKSSYHAAEVATFCQKVATFCRKVATFCRKVDNNWTKVSIDCRKVDTFLREFPVLLFHLNHFFMHYRGYMPAPDAEFIPWAKNITAQCRANESKWNLENAQVVKLIELMESAEAAWEAHTNPETANRRTAAEKKQAFSELKRYLSMFTNSFYVNEAITDADIAAMGLRPRHTHATQPKVEPGEAPEVTVVVGQHHDVTIYVSRPQHGEPVRSLNTKYYGFILRYRKEGETEWTQQMSTRLHIRLSFEPKDESKRLYFTVSWLNARLQNGPWSDEISTLIH